jgi:hypothetical protein
MKFGNLGKNKYVLIIYLLPNSCTKHILPWFGIDMAKSENIDTRSAPHPPASRPAPLRIR